MISEDLFFEQKDLPDGKDAGIESIGFSLSSVDNNLIMFNCDLNHDEEVIDADESDFPKFNCTLTVQQFKRLAKMFLRFDEQL